MPKKARQADIQKSEEAIQIYLDMVVRSALLFQSCIRLYLESRRDEFENRLDLLTKLESKADVQLRAVEGEIFSQSSLIGRGDILGFLETADNVVNRMDHTIKQCMVEQPDIPPVLHAQYIQLGSISAAAVESMASAIRAYFRDPEKVREGIGRVMENKKKANICGEALKRRVFRSDLALDRMMHLRSIADHIEDVAEEAEDVCDRLAVATIKRYER